MQHTAHLGPWATALRVDESTLESLREGADELRLKARAIEEMTATSGWQVYQEILMDLQEIAHAGYVAPQQPEHSTFIALTNREYGLELAIETPKAVQALAARTAETHQQAARREHERRR